MKLGKHAFGEKIVAEAYSYEGKWCRCTAVLLVIVLESKEMAVFVTVVAVLLP